MKKLLAAFVGALFVAPLVEAVTPPIEEEAIGPASPVSSFAKAKRLARDEIYFDHHTTLYCGCDYVPNEKGTGGKIGTQAGLFDTTGCGYTVRKSELRGRRLEWEHIVPASLFGSKLSCWINGDTRCTTSKGKAYKGRKCCGKVDTWFEEAEADLHNLAPSVGELNADRSNHLYDMLVPLDEPDETKTPEATLQHRRYGQCNFEVAGSPKLTEPKPEIRGDVARAWFYMSRVYEMPMTPGNFDLFLGWHRQDPVGANGDTWEVERDARIEKIQGNKNPYVHGLEPNFEDFIKEQ